MSPLVNHHHKANPTVGIPPERIYLDKKSGATTDRPGLRAALGYARGRRHRGAHP